MLKKIFVINFIFLAIAFLALEGLQAQTIYLKQNNGIQTDYPLSNIRKITFGSGNLIVTKTDNSTGVHALSGLQYFSYSDYLTALQLANIKTKSLFVYPNPVGDVLNINLPRAGEIQLLNIDGKVLQSKQVSMKGITTFSTQMLPKGIYLCRYNNEEDTKTVKIIKQ